MSSTLIFFLCWTKNKKIHFICLYFKSFLSFTGATKVNISSHLFNLLYKLDCYWMDLHRSPPRGQRHREGLAKGWTVLLIPHSREGRVKTVFDWRGTSMMGTEWHSRCGTAKAKAVQVLASIFVFPSTLSESPLQELCGDSPRLYK